MSKDKPIPRQKQSRNNARTLRKNPTKEENHLWYDFLRSYPIRFHRQYVIESYIVDFFCPKARLVIELDGNQHYEKDSAVCYDFNRTKEIEKYGIMVLRYTNLDIHRRFRQVCEDIDNHVQERMQPSGAARHLP
ncbi:MAG: DUF559 domain-containing protein [Ruminococcus sp.]|nr:DUF559 domain-containing protein [Ruminococcus sp.]